MALAPGQRIGSYEIVSKLGAGGMGEVYRARDSKLKRDVAIKVLPADVAGDRERLARFQREAEVLASLNHPNIAHVYGVEDGALVMELVDGEDLSQRISRGPMPVDEALPLARHIVEALEAAHSAGVVHRDLKPANIRIRDDATVKVVDFGLAKAVNQQARDVENSPTITAAAATAHGVILGTAPYMSPEQATGKHVDARADIWAFGCVLFEMLTGKRAFDGDSVPDILTAILRDTPDWRALPAATPLPIHTLLRRCLEKDLRKRAPHIAMARLEIDDAMTSTGELVRQPPRRNRGVSYVSMAVVAAACAFIAGMAAWVLRAPGDPARPRLIRTAFALSDFSTTRFSVQRQLLAISPDSRTLAVLSNGLHVRRVDKLEWTAVPDTLEATSIFASPDNQWIGFLTRSGVWKVSVNGGRPMLIANMADTANLGAEAAAWIDHDHIYLTDRNGVQALTVSDGRREALTGLTDAGSLDVLPGRGGLVYSRIRPDGNPVILLHTFDGREDVQIADGVTPKFIAADMIVFVRGGTLMGARLDLSGRRLRNEPVELIEGIATVSTVAQYDISDDGTLIYLPATAAVEGQSILTLRKSDGSVSRFHDAMRAYSDPRLSPDGKKLALHLFDQANDIWLLDNTRGALTRLTFDPREDETPVWSPDGRWVAYAGYVRDSSQERAVFRRRADGSGAEEMLWHSPNHSHVTDWSPDGKRILIELAHPQRRSDVVSIDVETGAASALIETPFSESSARISPDGHWIAYLSDESGRPEIYVQPFPALGRKLQISTSGGGQPIWSRDGTTLYFRSETAFSSAGVSVSGGTMHAEPPTVLFADTFMRPQAVNHTTYEVFPDGSMLLFAPIESAGNVQASVIAVFNWLDEAQAKIDSK